MPMALQRFWFWHLVFWLGYLLVKFTHLTLLVPLQHEQPFPYLATYTVVTTLNLLVTGLLGQHELLKDLSMGRQLKRLAVVLVPLLFSMIPLRQYLIAEYASASTQSMMTHWSQYFWYGLLLVLLPLLGWLALFMLMKLNLLGLQQLNQQQALLKEARQARLKVLRYQLDPHFMFNTLNALNALIVNRQADTAEQLIQQLCTFLRHSLKNQDQQWLPLPQELQVMQAYFGIQQIRFGERLVLDWQLELSPDCEIPALLFQPLAEYVVMATVATQKGQTQLAITLSKDPQDPQRLQLVLSSVGPQETAPAWPLTQWPNALHQLTERLQLLYQEQAALWLQQPNAGLYARLTFPGDANYVQHSTNHRG